MRRSVVLALCIASLFGWASIAHAVALPWTGEMTLDLGRFGTITGSTSSDTGVAMVGSSPSGIITTVKLSGGIAPIQTTLTLPVSDPGFISASAVELTATLGTGTLRGFASPGPLAWNAFPIKGMARFCFVANCGSSLSIPFFTATSATPSSLGSGVGLGGTLTSGVGTTFMRTAAGWQTSAATLFTSTTSGALSVSAGGFVHGQLSESQISVAGGGVLQLVTPTQITTTGPGGNTEQVALFTTLTIEIIPEPGKLIAALSGVVAVALLGLSRRRSRD